MRKMSFDYTNALDFVGENDIYDLQEEVSKCHHMLHQKTGLGKEFLGWVDLPRTYDRKEYQRIKEAAKAIRENTDVFIVIGIGGSYLGTRAAMGMLNHSFYNELPREKRNGPKIYFLGHHISSRYLKDLLETIEGDISVNVISKSGTTLEPAVAFRAIKEFMEDKYGAEGASKRIYGTTDRVRGALKELANEKGYETFVIPDDVGGRYSVLTPVGLLPMAVSGIDIDKVMEGAGNAMEDLSSDSLNHNMAYQYAVLRHILYNQGKITEIMVNYEPNLFYFSEWYKQLFGESEGKDHKGIFPSSMNFTTDLHSMGQYIQEGRRNLFETVLNIEEDPVNRIIKGEEKNLDGLNYLEGKSLDFVNKKAMEGTVEAHVGGGVPNLRIDIPEISPYYFGYMVYFFMKACGMSGYLLGVNPFNQPGVESYKKSMFRLLGKPED
ncbi:MAG: glucose-6-phosphate isomerase [Tissierellaceae bacterium]|nr:glucose-6-phosphate isomerase [Tissierellaceae bacterium]